MEDDSRVVIYDRNNMVWAARVWWMLRSIGFDTAAVRVLRRLGGEPERGLR